MTWSATFAERARRTTRVPLYLVQTIPADGTGDPTRTYSSARWPGHVEAVIVGECSVSWGGVQWPSLQQSGSSCTVALQANRVDMAGVRIGTIVQIRMVLGGDMEPVYTGILSGASTDTSSGIMRWELSGIEAALGGRHVTGSASRALFAEVGDTGVVSSTYTAGDSTLNHTQMTLRAGGTGQRCLKVTPNTGSPFYLVGSGDTGLTLTGAASGGALDTIVADADTGAELVACAFDAGHPITLFRRAVDPTVSDWPVEWRMGLPADAVDSADLDAEVDRHHTIGVPFAFDRSIQLVAEAPVSTLTEWIAPALAPLGIVPVQRHGQLTARVLYDAASLTGPTVTDADIEYASIQHWPSWPAGEQLAVTDRSQSQGFPVVPSDVVDGPYGIGDTAWSALCYAHRLLGMDPPPPPVRATASTSYSAPQTIPPSGLDPGHGYTAVREHALRIPAFGGDDGVYGTDAWRQEWRNDVLARLAGWLTLRPEVVTVTLPGWWRLAVGDGMALDLTRLRSRAVETDALRGAMGLIIGGGPDFFGTSTTYTVLVIPDGAQT